jgi:hypothetical protein
MVKFVREKWFSGLAHSRFKTGCLAVVATECSRPGLALFMNGVLPVEPAAPKALRDQCR